jgi:hypothetical protein
VLSDSRLGNIFTAGVFSEVDALFDALVDAHLFTFAVARVR